MRGIHVTGDDSGLMVVEVSEPEYGLRSKEGRKEGRKEGSLGI